MKYNRDKVIEIYEELGTQAKKSDVARSYAKFEEVEYTENIRKNVNKIIKAHKKYPLEETPKVTPKVVEKESFDHMPSAWSTEKNGFYTMEEYCERYGLNHEEVQSYKLVAHNAGHMVYNIKMYTQEELKIEEDILGKIEATVARLSKPIKTSVKPISNSDYIFDRLVYTDTHVGMEPNPDGYSLYGGKWDKKTLMEGQDVLVNRTLSNQKSNTLYIDDLGDLLDGWDKQTARGGHELPQNMSNSEAFDAALEFKVTMIDKLVNSYEKIVCNNICKDNHSADFGYICNKAFKEIVEAKYPGKVEANNMRSFINHYKVGNHVFILTHGKDDKNLKFGFKPFLDAKQEKKIDDYIDENFLFQKDVDIEFSKGDTHLQLFDDSTASRFRYYNYPAFSPSSDWIQTNFKKGMSGFFNFSYRKDGTKVISPYYFKWQK